MYAWFELKWEKNMSKNHGSKRQIFSKSRQLCQFYFNNNFDVFSYHPVIKMFTSTMSHTSAVIIENPFSSSIKTRPKTLLRHSPRISPAGPIYKHHFPKSDSRHSKVSHQSQITSQPKSLLASTSLHQQYLSTDILQQVKRDKQVQNAKNVLQHDAERIKNYNSTISKRKNVGSSGTLDLDIDLNAPSAKRMFDNMYWRFLLKLYNIVCFIPSKMCMVFSFFMAFFPLFCYLTVFSRVSKLFCRRRCKVKVADPTKTKEGRERANQEIYIKLKTYPFNLNHNNPFNDCSSNDSVHV